MKAISIDLILTSASTRADRSLGLRFSTPELEAAEKTAIFELQGQALKAIIQPVDGTPDSLVQVKASLDQKTPGQRLRAVLYLVWKQQNQAIDFEVFYREEMNKLIEWVKRKLEEQT